jgi:hypothetical protein
MRGGWVYKCEGLASVSFAQNNEISSMIEDAIILAKYFTLGKMKLDKDFCYCTM